MGSMNELETQLEIASNLGFIDESPFQGLHDECREIERMLSSLMRKL
jgi:four helix bundle protein